MLQPKIRMTVQRFGGGEQHFQIWDVTKRPWRNSSAPLKLTPATFRLSPTGGDCFKTSAGTKTPSTSSAVPQKSAQFRRGPSPYGAHLSKTWVGIKTLRSCFV